MAKTRAKVQRGAAILVGAMLVSCAHVRPSWAPVVAAVAERGSRLAVAAEGGCVVRRDHTTWCWGNYRFARGGTNVRGERVRELDDVRHVALGFSHGCAAKENGRVICWGRAPYGETGDVHKGVGGFHEVAGVDGAIEVAVGERMSGALLADGGNRLWGVSVAGVVGQMTGGIVSHGDPHPAPYDPGTPPSVQLVLGDQVCRVDAGGVAECTGGTARGCDLMGWGASPQAIFRAGSVRAIAVSFDAACALDRSARMECTEASPIGLQLGAFAALDDVRQMAIGGGIVCARRTDGSALCRFDRAGDDEMHEWMPIATGIVDLAAWPYGRACAMTADERVVCWSAEAPAPAEVVPASSSMKR